MMRRGLALEAPRQSGFAQTWSHEGLRGVSRMRPMLKHFTVKPTSSVKQGHRRVRQRLMGEQTSKNPEGNLVETERGG